MLVWKAILLALLLSWSPAHSKDLLYPFLDGRYGCLEGLEKGWRCEDIELDGVGQGSFLSLKSPKAPFLLAAPHGGFDTDTDTIVYNVGNALKRNEEGQWSLLIANAFRGGAPSGLYHNVNRPSLLDLDTCQDRPELSTSKVIWELYSERMDELSPRPRMLFEIHGQNEAGLEEAIELASLRVSVKEAKKIRKIVREELDQAGYATIEIFVEPSDKIFFNAGLTKACGSMGHVAPAPALHAEMPRIMRSGPRAIARSVRFYTRLLTRLSTEVFSP